ncbi:MAG: CAP domain-containing protein [Vicinamibacterales bacterium]
MRAQLLNPSLARHLRMAALLGGLIGSVACAASPSAPSPAGTAGLDSTLTFCADEANRYRASVGLPALGRSSALEAFAAQAAEHDHGVGIPHQFFISTNGGGVARAENQLLRWRGYGMNEVITKGMANMWAEGPGGSHYEVLTGSYTEVGCGVYVNGNEVSISQDFR